MHELAHPLIEVVSFCRTYFGNKLSTHDYLAWNWHDKRRRFVWYHSPFATIQHWWSWAITFYMALYNVQDLSTIVVVGLTLGILTNITFKQFSNAIFSWLEPQLAPQIMYHDWILIPVRNRAQPQPSLKHSMEEPIRKWILMHIHRIRRHQMLTWKTLIGKNHESPQTPTITMRGRIQCETQRQWPRALCLRQPTVTIENAFCFYYNNNNNNLIKHYFP